MNNFERHGIDVSVHNGNVNWKAVARTRDFAIIRAGFGKNNIDPKAKANIAGCEQYGIDFGVYWFSYAYTEEMARKEARYLVEFLGNKKPTYPLYFDFEYDSASFARSKGIVVTGSLVRKLATAFCEELEKLGYYAGIYCNGDYAKNIYNDGILDRYDVWYADWSGDKPDRECKLWQNSSSGTVDGVTSKVDTNIAFVDYPAIIKKAGLNGHKPEPVEKPEDKGFTCPHGCPHCPHSKKV